LFIYDCIEKIFKIKRMQHCRVDLDMVCSSRGSFKVRMGLAFYFTKRIICGGEFRGLVRLPLNCQNFISSQQLTPGLI
jgi:hypothetical protein